MCHTVVRSADARRWQADMKSSLDSIGAFMEPEPDNAKTPLDHFLGGLERLINALIDAVSEGGGRGAIVTSDGHDAEVRVTRLEGKRRPEEWRRSGSPHWDVDDPLIAKIVDLTEENRRLRWVVSALRHLSKSITPVDSRGAVLAAPDDLGQAIAQALVRGGWR